MIAESLCALGWVAAIFAPSQNWFFLAISLAAMFNDLTLPNAWATCQDIGQRYTAVTAACMNTIGTLGAVAASWLTGAMVEHSLNSRAAALNIAVKDLSEAEKYTASMSGYNTAFITFAAAYFISAICWRFIDCTKPIVDSPAATST
jgi:hypothetical protein